MAPQEQLQGQVFSKTKQNKTKGRADFLPAKSLTFPIQKKQERMTKLSLRMYSTVPVILICKFLQKK